MAFQVALAPDEQRPEPGGVVTPKSIVPDNVVPELNIPVMSKLIPTAVFPEKEGFTAYIVYEKLIDLTVLPVTEKEIGLPCDVVPDQFP